MFIRYIGDNYERLINKYRKFAHLNNYKWDDDVYQDTILKCYERIKKQGGLADNTDKGIENYFFLSLRNNLKREGQYSRNKKRVVKEEGELKREYGEYLENNTTPIEEKIRSDLFKDFSTLYIMQKAEQNFDPESFHAFATKTLCNLTYSQLQERTHIKGARTKCIDVKNWLTENISKEEITDAFNEQFGDFFE